MAAPPPPPPARGGGMSLYANLLDTDGAGSISRDPVLFKDDKDDAPATRKPMIDPALRFQPIRRPQITKPSPSSTKPKPPAFPKAPTTLPPSSSSSAAATAATTTTTIPANRNTLADWAATAEDDEYLYSHGGTNEKRQRGGRRKKKNKREDMPRETDWDELYDPARPTNVEEYLRSEERVREVREWRGVLYAHRRRGRASGSRGEGGGRDSGSEGEGEGGRGGLGNQFAPPASFTFAPPPMSPPRATAAVAAAPVPEAATGDDAYARRLALSGMAPPPPAAAPSPIPPPPPPPTDTDSTTISRAPIRYSQPPNPDAMDVDIPKPDDTDYDPEVDYASIPLSNPPKQDQDEEQHQGERTTRPGQQGFAQRLMAKYGWTKGTGLGASQSGITSALRVQVEKRKRKPDAEGGGFVTGPGGRGKIIAPKMKSKPPNTNNNNSAEGGVGEGGGSKFGKMSVVVVLDKMLDNMPDVEAEVEAGLGQEIGEECGERYGRVERIVVDVEGGRVFIRFVEGVSALRAVNALEGRIFNGNTITARFYDEEQFEEGVYDG